MTPTGKFSLRLLLLPRVLAAKGNNGEEVESWPDPPATVTEFFAARENLSGGEQIVAGLRQTTGAMRLRVKGRFLQVTAVDRVKSVTTGEVWNVTGWWRDGADTLMVVERAAGQLGRELSLPAVNGVVPAVNGVVPGV